MTEQLPEGVPVVPQTFDIPEVTSPTQGTAAPFTDVDIDYPKLPKTLPAWYAPGFHTYANVRKRVARLETAGYAPTSGPDYSRNKIEKNNRWQFERQVADGILDPVRVTDRLEELAQQYPMMSPDMLLGYALTPGAVVDPTLAQLDQDGVTQLLAQNVDATTGSAVGIGTGVKFDRKTTGIIHLPNGTPIEIGPGDVVIRDSIGEVVNVIPTKAPQEENDEGALDRAAAPLKNLAKAFLYTLQMPYEGLVGVSRNIGASLGKGDLGEAGLDLLSYLPPIAAIREMIEGDEYINPWEQTYMGQMILAAARGESIDVGTGWFIDPDSDIFARQLEASAGAYTIDGQASTFGRGLAGAFDLDPNSLAYRNLSGAVDFAAAVLLDPTVWMAGLGLPSKAARALTTPGRALGLGTPGAATVRGVRTLAGRESGTGTLEFGMARRQAAKTEARALRVADALPKAREKIDTLEKDLARAADDLERRTTINEQIAEARIELGRLEEEAAEVATESATLRLAGDLEDQVQAKVDAQADKERLGAVNTVARPSARLRNNADETREVEARLSAVERIAASSEQLSAMVGRALPKVGQQIERNGRPWTVSEVGDTVVLTSPKGARRKYTPEKFREEFSEQVRETPIHSRDELRTAVMDYVQKKAPDQRTYEVQAVEGVRTLPGDVTVTDFPADGALRINVGALDGEDMVAAWVGTDAPQLLHAAEQVPDTVMERLWERLSAEVLQRQQAEATRLKRQARKNMDDEEMSAALAQSWLDSEALGDDLLNLLAPGGEGTFPTPTWGDLLDGLNERGLASHLEQIIRDDGFDGIAGLLSRQPLDTDGIWWGYNPNIASYRARIGRLSEDPDVRIRANYQVDEDGLAMVLHDAEGLAGEAQQLQGRLADLQNSRDRLVQQMQEAGQQKNADLSKAEQQIAELERQIAVTTERWAAVTTGMEAVPNYTGAARAERLRTLRGRKQQIIDESERVRGMAERQARTLSRSTARIRNLATTMSREQKSLEGLRLAAGADLDDAGRGAVSTDAATRFLFGGVTEGALGRAGKAALAAMARVDSPSMLHAMTKGKLSDETVQRILAVTTQTVEDAKRLNPVAVENPAVRRAIDEGETTSTVATLRGDRTLSGEAAERALAAWKQDEVARILASEIGVSFHRPLSAGRVLATGGVDPTLVQGTGPTSYVVRKRNHPYVKRLFNVVPSAVKIDLHSPKDTAIGLKRYLDMAKVPEAEQWAVLDRLWEIGPKEPGQAALSRNVVRDVFDMLEKRLVDDVADLGLDEGTQKMLAGSIRKATRVWLNGESDAAIYWRDALDDVDAPIKLKMADGSNLPVTGAQIEAEMAHGALFLPDVEDFRTMVRRAATWAGKPGRALDQTGTGIKNTAEGLERFFSDYWRSFMLLRVSYMLRNVLEMQVRNFLTGHVNIFRHPAAALSMVIGPQLDPSHRMAKRFNLYSHDVNGVRFTSRKGLVDDPRQRQIVEAQHAEYLEMLRTDRALVDVRMYTGKSARKRGAPKRIGQDSHQFNEAWAEELMLLRGSPIVRVLAGGVPKRIADEIAQNPSARERILTNFVKHDASLEETRRIFHSAGPEYQAMLSDEKALSDFLFGTAGNASNVQKRLSDMTGGSDRLMEFIRTGKVQTRQGAPVRINKLGRSVEYLPDNYGQALDTLRETLTRYYKNTDDVTLPTHVRLWTQESGDMGGGHLDKALDAFFKVATRFERVGVMGPEWRYVYWDTIADLAPDMTLDAQEAMFSMFRKTGMTLHDKGMPLPRMRRAEKMLNQPKQVGVLTRDDVHRIASDRASEHVRDLYYDAHQRSQFWQSTRLAIPFGMAWYDTFAAWAKLAAQNPTQVYRAQRAFNAAMESGSNVIYEDADWALPTQDSGWFESPEASEAAPWYDPRQGVLYTDAFGERSFVIPGLGHAMTALGNTMNWGGEGDVPMGALQSQMRMNNLNLLTGGGNPMPGIGPAISLPLSPLLSRADSGAGQFLYDWFYPVGEPELGNGIIDQISPAFFRRLTSAIFDRDSSFAMSNMGAATHYRLSNGEYNMYDVADQERLLDDSMNIAKWFAAATAIGQFILPTVPSNVWVGESADGQRVGLAAASSIYYDGYRAMYDDEAQAQLAFLNDYGENFLFSFVGTTEDVRNGRILTSDAWELVKENPNLRAHSEEVAFLFPGGRALDFAALNWLTETGKRERRSASEWSVRFQSYLLQTRRERIRQQEVTRQMPASEVEGLLADIDDQIERAGGIQTEFARGGSLIEKTHAFIENHAPDDLVAEENVQVFLQLYAGRKELQQRAVELGLDKTSLDAKSLGPYRQAYLNGLSAFEAQFPQARPIIRTFRNEVQ